MKKLISENDGFMTWAYLTDAGHPRGYKHLKITTQWTNAKNPEDEQKKFDLLLSPAALNNLKDLLQ